MAIETSIKLSYQDLQKALEIAMELENFLKGLDKGHNVKINSSGISSTVRELSKVEQMASRVEASFSKIGGAMKTVGSGMQNLGNIFGGKVIGTVKTMATAFATMGLYSAAQGTVERYDTMRIFPKMMEHLGYSADDATAAVKKLEDAVIGLPTGLDEIVESARQLIPLTGDLEKGTNLAIAANNAFLAGGSDAQSVRYGQRQIKDLLAKGTLRSQEWDSLFTALGSGLGVIAKEMGYSDKASKGLSNVNDELKYAESRLKSLRNTQKRLQKEGGTAKAIAKNTKAIKTWEEELAKLQSKQDKSLGSFRNALKTNQISALDFLDALERAGTGEGELAKRADDYKDTISAAARNIKNALQKMGAAGLEALDNVLVEKTGKGIPGTIRELSDAIKQNLIPALEGWVSAHGDDIVNFFDRIKNYDWGNLISRVGNGLSKYYDLMTRFFTKISPKVIAFMSVWASPVGRALSTGGGLVGGLGHFFGGLLRFLGKFGSSGAVTAAEEGAAAVGRIGINLTNAFKGLALTAGITGEVALIGGVIAEYAKIMEMISNLKMGGNFSKNMDAIVDMAGRASIIAGGMTALFGALSTIPGFTVAAATGEILTTGFFAMVGQIGNIIDQYARAIDDIATMSIPSDNRMKDVGKTIKSIKTNLLDNVEVVPTSKVNSMKKMSEMVDYVADVAVSLKKVRDVGQVGDLSSKIQAILKGTDEILRANYDKGDKKKSKTIKGTMENLADAVEAFAGISSTLIGMRGNIDALTKGGQFTVIDNLASRMKNILGNLGKAMKDMQFNTFEFEESKDNVAKISKAVESIASIASTLVGARDNINSLVKQEHNGRYTADIGYKITNLMKSLLPVVGAFQWKTGEYERGVANIARFASIADSISTIVTSIFDARDKINTIIKKDDHGHYTANQDDLINKLYGMFNSMKVVSDLIDRMDIDTGGEAKEKMTALSDVIGQLPDIITSLSDIKDPVSKLGVEGKKWQLGDDIGTIIGGLQDAFANIVDSDYINLQENAGYLASAVSQLESIMTGLKGVQTNIGALGISGGVWQAGEDLGIAIRTITGMFGDGEIAQLSANNVFTALGTNLGTIVAQLGMLNTNASAASKSLNQAKSGIDKMGSSAKTHKGAVQDLATAASKLKAGVNGIGGKATSAAGGITLMGIAAGNQVSNLSAAASAALALANAIDSIPTNKTVNIGVSGTGVTSVGGLGGSGHPSQFATGGVVHGRGGIDNVRAWLTNGEYVMRRGAHKAFGTAFMNRVNNLDVEGALRALTIRAGAGVRSRASITNNYTRDNHANVTFNVNRATQGYSQRRASRWARALS